MVREHAPKGSENTPRPISPVHHISGCNEEELQPDHPDYLLCKQFKECMQLIKERAKLPPMRRLSRDSLIEKHAIGMDMAPLDIEPIQQKKKGLERRRLILEK